MHYLVTLLVLLFLIFSLLILLDSLLRHVSVVSGAVKANASCTFVCVCMYLGVVLASIGAGLGEYTFLSLMAHFDKSVTSSRNQHVIFIIKCSLNCSYSSCLPGCCSSHICFYVCICCTPYGILPSMLWHCWAVDWQDHRVCKNWVIRCWRGLSGVRWKWLASWVSNKPVYKCYLLLACLHSIVGGGAD